MGVQPNPELAAALQRINIPPNLTGWSAFRDYAVKYNQEGVAEDAKAELQHLGNLVSHLAAAQTDTIETIIFLDEQVRRLNERLGGQQ